MTTNPAAEPIRWLTHGPDEGAWNMAVDHALMTSARRGRITVRLYGWDPPCLSVGRNQRARGLYSPEEAERMGVDVVRRPTGGRSVFHDREVTYAVAAPADRWGGLRDSYARLNGALRRGLRRLGVPVGEAGDRRERAPGPGPGACFSASLPGEVTAGGRKLVGSAQWREDGALLQQGSVLLADQQEVVARLRTREPAAAAARSGGEAPGGGSGAATGGGGDVSAGSADAAALEEFVDPVPGFDRVADALRRGFREEFGPDPVRGELDGGERARARELRSRYDADDWTWRR